MAFGVNTIPLGRQTVSILIWLLHCAYCLPYLSMISGGYRSPSLLSYYFNSIIYFVPFNNIFLGISF